MKAKSAIKEIERKIELYKESKEKDIALWDNRITGLETALQILKDNEPETSKIDVLENEKEEK